MIPEEKALKTEWNYTDSSFKAMIIGKLLGDGSITIQEGRKPRFQFTHTSTDYLWSKYCYEQLKVYLPLNAPKFKKTMDPRLKSGYSLAHYTQSKTANVITYLRSQWYIDSGKRVPFELITKYFNLQSLAWWYMDDGHLKQYNNKPEKIILSTESFKRHENIWLINFLQKKYNLTFRLDKQNRIILYDQYHIHYFLYLVTPYLHTSMHRKIIKRTDYIFNLTSKRTTIYLPASIDLKYPTKEINTALKRLDELIRHYKLGLFYETYSSAISNKYQTKGYQIVLNNINISNLHLMNTVTGIQYSKLAEICFTYYRNVKYKAF